MKIFLRHLRFCHAMPPNQSPLVCLFVRLVKLQRSGTLGPRPLVRLCSSSKRRVARENVNGKHTPLFNPVFARSHLAQSHKSRPMRLLVCAVVLLVARCALAIESVPVVLYEARGPHGERVQFRSDTNVLWNLPIWTAGGEGPPLSLEAATKIAMKAGLKQSPKASGISFGDIKLLRRVFDHPGGKVVTWFWVFSVSPVMYAPNREPVIGPARDIVILLDGKTVEATPLK
jgi:hypothetical protein